MTDRDTPILPPASLLGRALVQRRRVGRRGPVVAGLALAVAAVVASPVKADPASPLVGVWKVTGYELQVVGDPPTRPFGVSPKGVLVVTPGGRWLQLVTAADRKAASTDPERARLLQGMIAYSGRYRIEGDRVVTDVDASWNEVYVGPLRTQTRSFEVNGRVLTLRTGEIESAVMPGKRISATVVFEREE